jgi:hypothetical protein
MQICKNEAVNQQIQLSDFSNSRKARLMIGKSIKSESEILIYQTKDGQTKVEAVFDGETVWP